MRHWRELAAVTAVVAATGVCASDATAQKNPGPPNALRGFSQNRDEPVKIRAASLEVREKDKMATFTGDVYVLQGDFLDAKLLKFDLPDLSGASRWGKLGLRVPGAGKRLSSARLSGVDLIRHWPQSSTPIARNQSRRLRQHRQHRLRW
jgi:hypothetical protein